MCSDVHVHTSVSTYIHMTVTPCSTWSAHSCDFVLEYLHRCLGRNSFVRSQFCNSETLLHTLHATWRGKRMSFFLYFGYDIFSTTLCTSLYVQYINVYMYSTCMFICYMYSWMPKSVRIEYTGTHLLYVLERLIMGYKVVSRFI